MDTIVSFGERMNAPVIAAHSGKKESPGIRIRKRFYPHGQ